MAQAAAVAATPGGNAGVNAEPHAMVVRQARSLAQHYTLLLVLLAVPLLLLVLGLGLRQFLGERERQLDDLAQLAREQRLTLDAALVPLIDHVAVLRLTAEDRLGKHEPHAPSPMRELLSHVALDGGARGAGGITLDAIAGSPLAKRVGNIVAGAPLLERTPDAMQELDMALELFGPMRLRHEVTPYLRRSYYASARGDLLVTYPFATTAELAARTADARDLASAWLGVDLLTEGTPGHDPMETAYWTGARREAGGDGWVVSHAAPVYEDGRFAGVVGADLGLASLSDLLRQLSRPAGQAWVVDDGGRVLAGPGAAADGARLPTLGELVPALAEIPADELLQPSVGFRHLAGHWLAADRLGNAPLTLLFAAPDHDLHALILPRFLPYGLTIGALLLVLAAVQLVLQRGFVRPALALVRQIQAEARGLSPAPARVPPLWRPWLEAVREAFADRRAYEARLAASEERLKAAAESIPDGLAIFDAEDRFVFVNSRYPQHITPALAGGCAWAYGSRTGCARGLAEGRSTTPTWARTSWSAASRCTGRSARSTSSELVDGRWLRLREARMRDGGRVLLTTDVTASRAQQKALAEQTRKLEAVLANIAEGVGITDPSGRVLLVNDGLLRLYGMPPEFGAPGTPLAAFIEHRLRSGFITPKEAGVPLPELVERRVARFLGDGRETYEESGPEGRTILVRRQRLPDGLIVSTHTDITELKRRERENTLLATALDQAGNSVEVTDADYHLTYVNPAFTRLTGWSREEALGHRPSELLRSHRHDPAFFAAIGATLERGEVWQGQLTSRHKDGRLLFQEATISPVRDARGRLTHIVAVKRDIGERIRAENALKESEARYRAVVETQSELILRLRPDGSVVFTNDAYCRYRGLPRKVLLGGYDDIGHYPPYQRARIYAAWAGLTPERPTITYELEEPHPETPGGVRHEEWTDTAFFDDEGRLVEIQAVGREITSRKHAERALKESEARYRAVVEGQTEFIVRHRPDGTLTFVNDAICRQTGKTRKRLMALPPGFEHHPPAERAKIEAAWASFTPERPRAAYEMVVERPGLGLRHEEWTDTAIFDADGRLTEIQGVGRDVTERRRAEQALKASEELLRSIVDNQTEVVARYDADFRCVFSNMAHARLFGRRPEEVVGVNFFDSVPERLRDRLRAELLALTPGRPVCIGANEKVLPDGEVRWFEWVDRVLFDDAGRRVGYLAVGRDVTEQYRAEQALKESEARLAALLKYAPLIIHLKDREGRYLLANAETEKMFGFDPALAIGKTPQEVFPAVDELSEWGHREVVETGRVVVYEEQKPKIGPYEWSHVVRFPLLDDKGEVAVVGCIAIDITERKRAETALRESEARLQALMEHAPLVVHLKDREGRYVLANPEAARIFGRPPAEVMGKTPFEVFPPEEAEVIDRHHREVLESGRSVVHEEFQPSLDAYQWSLVVRFPIRDAKGEIAVVGGFALDITERKRAEEALKASEARLAAFMEHAPVGMYLKGLDGRYVMLNPETGRVFGRPAEEMLGRRPEDAFPPEQVEVIRRNDAELLERGAPTRCEEYLQGREGYGWSLVIRFPVRDGDGRIVQIGGFDLDITAQKRAVAELAASEERFRTIVEDQTEFISRFAPDFTLTFINQAYARQLGRAREEVVGSSVLDLMNEEQQARFKAQLATLTPEAPTVSYEMDAVRPDGSPGWEQWTDRALFDAEGRRRRVPVGRPRRHRAPAGRGGGRPPPRGAAPEREDDGPGLAPRRGRARAQQPALGGDRLRRDAPRHGHRSGDPHPRRAGPRGGRALRPDRQDLPRDGAPEAPAAGAGGPARRGRERPGADRLRAADGRRDGRGRRRARPSAGLGRRRPAPPGAGQPRRQRAAGPGPERAAAPARDPRRGPGRHGRGRGRGQRARHAAGRQEARLRAVLHHQAAGCGHRHRALGLPRHRRRARRPHRGRERAGPRHPVPGHAAGGGGRCRGAGGDGAGPRRGRRGPGAGGGRRARDRGACGRDAGAGRLRGRGRHRRPGGAGPPRPRRDRPRGERPQDAGRGRDGADRGAAGAGRARGAADPGHRRRARGRDERGGARGRHAGAREAARPRRAAARGPPDAAGRGGRRVTGTADIIVVDDEPDLRLMLEDYLSMQGFRVRQAADGAELDQRLARGPGRPPGPRRQHAGRGRLRDRAPAAQGGSRAGILMLTAAGDVPSRVRGLDGGADDYLAKPVELRELLARVRSVLRRVEAEPEPAAAPPRQGVRFGRCTLDLGSRRLEDADGAEIPLTAMEYDLLAVFARHPRQVLSRERLAELAHNRPLAPGDRSVDIRITRLRQKLEPDAANPTVLRTVRGEGYAYEPEG